MKRSPNFILASNFEYQLPLPFSLQMEICPSPQLCSEFTHCFDYCRKFVQFD